MGAEGEEEPKRRLAEEKTDERTFALQEIVFDDVVHARFVRAEGFEAMCMPPMTQRPLVLDIDEAV
jgi:hypothetical protein